MPPAGRRAVGRLAALGAPLLLALPWPGCGPGAGATEVVEPAPPASLPDTPALPDLGAPASFSATYLLVLTDPVTRKRRVLSCPGRLSITTQRDSSFTGEFEVSSSAACGAVDSGRLHGTLFRYGEVELDLQVAGLGVNELPAPAGCAYAGPASAFAGAVNAKKLVALSHAAVRCPGAEGLRRALDLRVRIDAGREPSVPDARLAAR
ncbi:MAG: hypothetical protein ABR599_06705 [Gemmatimonadota bacterium]